MKVILATFVLLVVCAGASAGQELTDPALNKVGADFTAAFNSKDAAKLARFYAESAVLMPPNAPLVKGRAAIQAYYEGLFKQGASDLRLTPIESANFERQHGFEAGTSSVQLRSPTGSAAIRSQGKYLRTFRSIRGEWKIAHEAFNDDVQPPAR